MKGSALASVVARSPSGQEEQRTDRPGQSLSVLLAGASVSHSGASGHQWPVLEQLKLKPLFKQLLHSVTRYVRSFVRSLLVLKSDERLRM